MAPENVSYTPEPTSGHSDANIPLSNNIVEPAAADLPPYAHTVNGGMPPFNPSYISENQPPRNIPAGYPPYPETYPYQHQAGPASYTAYFPAPSVYQPAQRQADEPISASTAPPIAHSTQEDGFDYDNITSPARIAIYDDLRTAPRVIQIQGAPTHEYIERIASLTYKHAKEAGGAIPYTVIREVSENFIHARFQEIVVSIMDSGNTIRFADQGPGISSKELVQEPGFSSATEPMKRYIRGVGSGLPIVREYLDTAHGYIEIEDNINKGSVVTISLVATRSIHDAQPEDMPDLTENEERILKALLPDQVLGVTDMNRLTEIPVASIHTAFSKMEQNGLVEKVNKKRTLTAFGKRIATKLA